MVVSDLHCGHVVGLTPPEYQFRSVSNDSRHNKFYTIQSVLWNKFQHLLQDIRKQFGLIDGVINVGDSIDGKGERSGGVEQIKLEMGTQVAMSVKCFDTIREICNPKAKFFGVYGTAYHTSTSGDEWEDSVYKDAGFEKWGSHEWVDVNGCIIDVKHHIGTSVIPHGRGTAVLRDMLWNDMWSLDGSQPRANIVLRGHAHYYQAVDTDEKLGIICPALQGMGSKFGSKICSGRVSWGVIVLTITNKNEYEWHKKIVTIEEQKAKVVSL